MANRKDVDQAVELIEACRPVDLFSRLSKAETGAAAVLRILHRAGEAVSAGTLSQSMRVSTARVAALLKKLERQGLITRSPGAEDARLTLVRLTETGAEKIERMYQDYCGEVGRILDRVGMDRFREFIATAREIGAVMTGPPDDLL